MRDTLRFFYRVGCWELYDQTGKFAMEKNMEKNHPAKKPYLSGNDEKHHRGCSSAAYLQKNPIPG